MNVLPTAREGVGLVGSMASRFGYTASGRTYTIAGHRKQVWLVALVERETLGRGSRRTTRSP